MNIRLILKEKLTMRNFEAMGKTRPSLALKICSAKGPFDSIMAGFLL